MSNTPAFPTTRLRQIKGEAPGVPQWNADTQEWEYILLEDAIAAATDGVFAPLAGAAFTGAVSSTDYIVAPIVQAVSAGKTVAIDTRYGQPEVVAYGASLFSIRHNGGKPIVLGSDTLPAGVSGDVLAFAKPAIAAAGLSVTTGTVSMPGAGGDTTYFNFSDSRNYIRGATYLDGDVTARDSGGSNALTTSASAVTAHKALIAAAGLTVQQAVAVAVLDATGADGSSGIEYRKSGVAKFSAGYTENAGNPRYYIYNPLTDSDALRIAAATNVATFGGPLVATAGATVTGDDSNGPFIVKNTVAGRHYGVRVQDSTGTNKTILWSDGDVEVGGSVALGSGTAIASGGIYTNNGGPVVVGYNSASQLQVNNLAKLLNGLLVAAPGSPLPTPGTTEAIIAGGVIKAIGLTSTAGVAVGGALTGATTGAFSSSIVANTGSGGLPITLKGLPSNETTNAGLWFTSATPSSTNYALQGDTSNGTVLNAPTGGTVNFRIGNVSYGQLASSGRWMFGNDLPANDNYSILNANGVIKSTSVSNPVVDRNVFANYAFVSKGAANTVGNETGIAFSVSTAESSAVGASITHQRTGANSRGHLDFWTKDASYLTHKVRISDLGGMLVANRAGTLPADDTTSVIQANGVINGIGGFKTGSSVGGTQVVAVSGGLFVTFIGGLFINAV